MHKPKISLDHWAAFKAVIDTGSFALAAELLNKSQSSVSYAIARLNEQLPKPVLHLQGRKAELTEDGKVLYKRACQLLEHAQLTEDYAQLMARGLEAEITLALDALLDIQTIIPALESLAKTFPSTRVRVLETSLSGTEEALLERKADIALGATVPIGFTGVPIKTIEMIPVARPDHPLFGQVQGDTTLDDWQLKASRQIVLRDTGARREQDVGWLGSEQRWTVSHFASSLKILRSGLGFAFMPRNWVEHDLKLGHLKQLPLGQNSSRIIPLYLIRTSSDATGPATKALADTLLQCFGKSNH